MAVESPAWANQSGSYNAEQTRRAVFAAYARTGANNPGIITGGLLSAADLQLSAPVSGMSVNVSTGEAIIGGTEGGSQGGYYARATSQTNLAISASNPSNPRVDTVCATISDSGYTEPTGGSGNQWALQVATGTPTSGATLVNLNGVATLPLSSLLLGYVLVPATATNIITADIANVATVARMGLVGATTLIIQTRTASAGVALVNSTPNILTFAAPSDSQMHPIVVAATLVVTSNETGGAIQLTWTSGGQAQLSQLWSAGQVAGSYFQSQIILCDPGTTATLKQSSALTAGASSIFAAMSGA